MLCNGDKFAVFRYTAAPNDASRTIPLTISMFLQQRLNLDFEVLKFCLNNVPDGGGVQAVVAVDKDSPSERISLRQVESVI